MIYRSLTILLLIPSLTLACTLVWDAPTTDVLGNPIDATDIAAYRVYVEPKSQTFTKGQFKAEIQGGGSVPAPPATSIACAEVGLTSSKHAAVTAVSTSQDESDFSNTVVRHIPGPPEHARKQN